MIIKNAKVYSDGCRFVEKDLIIRDGRIVFGAAPQGGEEVNWTRAVPMRLPGLVDIHFHGASRSRFLRRRRGRPAGHR